MKTLTEKIESWKKEFYPKPAHRTAKKHAVSHSLQKWMGFTRKNLKKHGLDISLIVNSFDVNSETCALCHHYIDNDACSNCPLYQVREETRCDWMMPNESLSPYNSFISNSDPLPMIKWLRRALKHEQKNKSKRTLKKIKIADEK